MALFAKLKERLKGVREKWSGGISKLFSSKTFDSDFWDNLEEQLISGDTGLDFTEEIIEFLKKEVKDPSAWNILSMGMSQDYKYAIKEGATHIRIGTAIFGDRNAYLN